MTLVDFREQFGIKNGITIEIGYERNEWVPAVVDSVETGKTWKFYDTPDEKEAAGADFMEVPIINVFKHGEREPTEICFINRCLLFDTKLEESFNWKMFDEPWDVDTEGSRVMAFRDLDGLRNQVSSFVPEILLNVVNANEEFINNLPEESQITITNQIMTLKDTLIEKIIKFFIDRGTLSPGTSVVLDIDSLKILCNEALNEMCSNTI